MRIKIRRTDTLFSDLIRERDKWTCQRCQRQYDPNSTSDRLALHTSHYWSRGKESTRFEPDNCIALCMACHLLWGHGDQRDQYKEFMVKRLGEARFKSLMVQANTYKKRDDKMDLLVINQLIKLYGTNDSRFRQ